jgi:HD-GYP domain-containing protein (c-di-GMP phosphodiesterase class II)
MVAYEEKRTIKWFLLVFYIIFVAYDYFYYYIEPIYITNEPSGFPSNYWYITYFMLAILIPFIYYLGKVDKRDQIKYVFFISYAVTAFIVDILSFYGTHHYKSGNLVEVFLILSLPLFLNKKYFWIVVIGMAAKYLLTGVILQTTYVAMPIIFLAILSILSYFLLVRFQGYVRAISNSYDEQLEGMVKGVIATLELKDPYTRGHSERVASYALLLAKQVGQLSNEEEKSFYYACLLHDIGKVNIPDSILMKPEKLTNEEYQVIKTHPVVGAEAVKNVEGIMNSLCVIRSHHERWDGKGYPDQTKGEETPFLARLVAIADAFDAMTSSRSYRDAMPVEKAYQIIIDGQGSQFDPMLVEEFKKVYPAWVKFHEKYPWTKKWEMLREVSL